MMSTEKLRFKVFAVFDGNSWGLFVKKINSKTGFTQKAYFYLKNGLRPTHEILKTCEGNSHLLCADDSREERIVNEIISYAKYVNLTGQRKNYEFSQNYQEQRGYQEVVDRYYESDRFSVFKEFFVSASILKKGVLRNSRGNIYQAEGMAEEFDILDAHSISVEGFKYTRKIEDVMELDTNHKSMWFRKSGPIAIDFKENKVYSRRKLLHELKELISNKSFAILEGAAASGKTVLAYQLGYELCKNDKKSVYYFNCALERDFELNELVKDIDSGQGIFILDNIHLETTKFQRVYSKVKRDKHRHVLFVTRPSFRDNCSNQDCDLTKIKRISLEQNNDIDNIIGFFALQHSDVSWDAEIRAHIKYLCGTNFWLLSYALKGYVDNPEEKDHTKWLAKGVQDDLEEMERLNFKYPELLVALSPLYSNEVLTDERFLTEDMRFDQNILNELVKRGDVTKQKKDSEFIFYGLTHSILACVYWKYGKVYKRRLKLSSHEDFIYNYATKNVCNGLKAVIETNKKTRQSLLARLEDAGAIVAILNREKFMQAIEEWVDITCGNSLSKEGILKILARKINSSTDTFYSLRVIRRISINNEIKAKQLCELLNINVLATTLIETKAVPYAAELIAEITKTNKDRGVALWNRLDKTKLVEKLQSNQDLNYLLDSIVVFFELNEKIGKHFWQMLNLNKIADKLQKHENVFHVIEGLGRICKVNQEVGQKLCSIIDVYGLRKKLEAESHKQWIASSDVIDIYKVNVKVGSELWAALGCRKLTPQEETSNDIEKICFDLLDIPF